MELNYLIEELFRNLHTETAARLNIMMSSDELIKAVKENAMIIINSNVYQSIWHKFYPLVADGKWEVVDSTWADTWYHGHDKPIFLDVELYKEWLSDKDNFYKNHRAGSFNEDSSGIDGMCDIICGGQSLRFREESKYVKNDYLDSDCIAIMIYKPGREYDMCDGKNYSYRCRERNLNATFILKPKAKTKKERQEIVIELFRSTITKRLADIKLKRYMNSLVPKLAKEILSY